MRDPQQVHSEQIASRRVDLSESMQRLEETAFQVAAHLVKSAAHNQQVNDTHVFEARTSLRQYGGFQAKQFETRIRHYLDTLIEDDDQFELRTHVYDARSSYGGSGEAYDITIWAAERT